MLAMQETTERGVWFGHEVERLLPDYRLRRSGLVRAGRTLPF